MKKLIVVDLDGTLLNSDGVCSEVSSNYLKKLKDEGHIIVIATGRRLCSALEVTNNAYFANYVICDCGSGIYDVDKDKFIYKSTIEKDLIKKLYTLSSTDSSSFKLCTQNDLHDINSSEELSIDKINNIIDNSDDVFHITINIKDSADIYKIRTNLSAQIPELNFLVMQNSFEDRKWFDICNVNNSKYNSILKVAGLEKIKNDDIICFGDGLNDIDMIKKCGVGVAMGNALNDVKKVADFITTSHDEDGIASFLQKNI